MVAPQYAMSNVPIAWHGSDWQWQVGFTDSRTGGPLDFTALPPGYVLTTTLRSHFGAQLAVFNTTGTGDGTLTGNSTGVLTWFLPQAVVNTLPATRTFRGGTDPRVATWRYRGLISFDLVETYAGNSYTILASQLTVSAQIHA